jgi:phage terminase large subunit-like protein
VYQEVGLGLPRKNGKSLNASAAGLYFLTADGEAEPEVYVGAGAQQQAGIVLRQSLSMARQSPALKPYVKVQKYLIECPSNGGIMRALSSDGGLQHGLSPSCNLIDEVHAHKTPDLYTALTTGTGAREQPMTLWITSAGLDEENLLSDLYGQMFTGPGELERRGPCLLIYRDRAAGVLIHWYGAPKDADPADPAMWLGANPASWQTQDVLAAEYRKLTAKGHMLEWRIYHLNQIMGAEESWLPDGAWQQLVSSAPDADPWHGMDPALPIGVGVEKAPMSNGGAVVAAQRQTDGSVVVRAQHFPADATTGRVNVEAMRLTLRTLRGRFPAPMVRDPKTKRAIPGPAFAFDPWAFTESAETLELDGLNMVDFPQAAGTMGPASTTTYELVTTGRLTHDGDPVLARHLADTVALLTGRGMKVTKGKKRPNHSAVAMVMAVAMATQEAPKPFVRTPRIARGF